MFSDEMIKKLVDDAKSVWPANWPEIEEMFNKCCFSASVDVIMRKFQLFQKKNDFETMDSINQKVKIFDDAMYVFTKMLDILCEEKVLEKKDNGYICINDDPEIESPTEALVIATRKIPSEGAPFQWLARGIGGLYDFIRGRLYGEEVMFGPYSDFTLTEEVYFNSNVYGFWSILAGKTVKRIIEEEYKKKISILEIGAGTGNGTFNVFENTENVTDKFEKYIFTDVNKNFLRKAKKSDYFSKFDFIEYKELDATKDILEQGFEENMVDIVLAVNVLHASDNLLEGCKTAYKLVREGGYVVLGEIAPPQGGLYRYMELTFGLLASYYKYNDIAERPDCPIIRPDKWIEVFKKAGFKDVIAMPHDRLEGCDRGGVVIARK